MKIGIDVRLWGTQHAGIGRYTEELVRNLQDIDTDIEYVLFCRKNDSDKIPVKANWRRVVADIPHYTLREQVLLPGIFKRENLDLLHVPHFNVPIRYKGRFIVTIHDILWHQMKGLNFTTLPAPLYLIKHLGYRAVVKNAVSRAEKIIVPSKSVKTDLIKTFNVAEAKIAVIYEGISTLQFSYARAYKNGILRQYILYVGSLYPHKNVESVVRALKLVPNAQSLVPNLVVVCGRSIFWEKFKKFIEKENAQSFVKLVGYVSDKELGALYKNAQAFVFPTLSEGFGLPGLEAMAAGTPVVCSDIPVLHEIYGDAVLYFNPRDANDITNKIMQILANEKLRAELVSKGKSKVKLYSWRKMAEETLKVYKTVGI